VTTGLTRELLPARGPRRVLAAGVFVNSYGGGMFVTSSALYFTRVVGLSAEQVALGLFLGSAVGLLAGVLVGQLADRCGPKTIQIGVMVFGAASMSCYLLVSTFVPFALVCVCIGLTYAANDASRAPLIRGFGGDDQAAYRAYLRSAMNLSWALGALTAGIGIQLDTPAMYRALIIARALAFLGSGLVLLRLPRLAPVRVPPDSTRWAALRDRTYLTATVLNSIMALHLAVPTFLLPLWIVGHTDAPRVLVAGMLLINTLLIVVLQVPVSRGVDDRHTAGIRMRWAGVALLAGLALMAAAGGFGVWASAGVLVAGMVVYTLGELWHSAAQMEWMFGLAPAHAQGQYAGVFGLGTGISDALGPVVLVVCLHWGVAGWLLVGTGFLVVGAVSPPLVAWAGRAPAPAPVPAHAR
jgi:MFS family permease